MSMMTTWTEDSTTYFTEPFLKTMTYNQEYTFDIPELNQYKNHYIFLYGTLKATYPNNKVIMGNSALNKYCGVGVTETDKYDMWIAENDGKRFPVAIQSGDKKRKFQIKGELWLVDTNTLMKMDRYEHNNHVYERVTENIFVGTQKVPAYMYVGKVKFWRDKDTVINPIIPQHGKKYHHFSLGIANRIKIGDKAA